MEDRFDIVIVGAGPAGLACAIAAAERGAHVALLEKSDHIGGALHISSGQLSGAGTEPQRRAGIHDSTAGHLADIERISHGTTRADLTEMAVGEAASVIDWLDANGMEWAPGMPAIMWGHEPYSVPRTSWGVQGGLSLLHVLERLLRPHLGCAVELALHTRVTALVFEAERVVGVAWDGGQARGPVVLTTGGFGSDAELHERYEGVPLRSGAAATSTGDGLRLALSARAGVQGQRMWMPTFGALPARSDPQRVEWTIRPRLIAGYRPPWEIYVDRHGHRFIAEDEASAEAKERALLRLPEMTFFAVLDDRAVEESAFISDWAPEQVRAAAGTVAGITVGATLTELAQRAGVSAAGLEHTVAAYNAGVGAGQDTLGRRFLPAPIERAPFYAFELHATTLITFAGVDVDDLLRVRRDDGSVIDGLYAAGEVIGAAATSGQAYCGGMAITPALAFGRLLGQRLAPPSAGAVA